MKIILRILFAIVFLPVFKSAAQSPIGTQKFIEVTGSAEKSVIPDAIELEIVLTEYTKDGAIVKLSNIEKEFFNILKNNNIDTGSLQLNGLESNNWWYWWNNRNKPLKTKTYKLSIDGNINFLKLAEDLYKKWVESVDISDKKNKNIAEYRKEVKIAAIKAAKEKASYLLESVGEQLGELITVEEVPEFDGFAWRTGSALSNTSLGASSFTPDEVENVSRIKLRYQIKVKFAIK